MKTAEEFRKDLRSIIGQFLPEFLSDSVSIDMKKSRVNFIKEFIENFKKEASPDMKENSLKVLGEFLKYNGNNNIINKLSSMGIKFDSPSWLDDIKDIAIKFGAEFGNPEDAIQLAKKYEDKSGSSSSIISPDPAKAMQIREALLSSQVVPKKIQAEASYDLGKQLLSKTDEQASPALKNLGNKLLHRAKFLGHTGDFTGLTPVGDYKGESPLNVKEEMDLIEKAQKKARGESDTARAPLVAQPSVQSTGTIQPQPPRPPLVAQTSGTGSASVPQPSRGVGVPATAAISVPPTPRVGTTRTIVPPLPTARREGAHAAGIESVPPTPRSTIGILPPQRVSGAAPEPSFVPQVDLTHAGTNIASLFPQDHSEDYRTYLRRLATHGAVQELENPTPYLGARVAPLDEDELLATEGFRRHLANRRQAPAEAKLTKMYEELMKTDPEMAKKVQEDLARYGQRTFEDPDFEKYRNQYSNNVLNVMKKRFDRNVQDDLEKLTARYRQLNALNTPAFHNEKAKLLERAREAWGDQEKLLLESREREARTAWNEDQKKLLDRVRAATDTMEREKQRRLASGSQYGAHVAGSEDRDITNLELQRMYGEHRRRHHQAEADAARGAHDEATAMRQYNINRLANISAGHALPEPGVFEPTPPTAEAASPSPWVGAGAAVGSIGRHITEQQNARRDHALKQQELQQQRAAQDLRAQELELLRNRQAAPAPTAAAAHALPVFKEGGTIKSFRDQYKDQYFKKAMDQTKRLMNEEESHGSLNNLLSGFTKGLLKRPKDVVGWDSLNHGFEGVVDAQEAASKNMKETRDKADVLQEAVLNTLYKVDKEGEEAALKKAELEEKRRKNDASIAHMSRKEKLDELKLALEHGYDPENKFGAAHGLSKVEKEMESKEYAKLMEQYRKNMVDASILENAIKQRSKVGWAFSSDPLKSINLTLNKVSPENRPLHADSWTAESDVKNMEEKLAEINEKNKEFEYIKTNYRRPGDLEKIKNRYTKIQIDENRGNQSNNTEDVGDNKVTSEESTSKNRDNYQEVKLDPKFKNHEKALHTLKKGDFSLGHELNKLIKKFGVSFASGILSPLNLAGLDVKENLKKTQDVKFDPESLGDRVIQGAGEGAGFLIPAAGAFKGLGLASKFPNVAKGFALNPRNFLGSAGAGVAAGEAVHHVDSKNPLVNLAVGIPAAILGGAGTEKLINMAARNIFKSGAAKTLPEAKNIVLKNLEDFGLDPSGKDVIQEGSKLEAIYNWLSKYGGIGKKEQKRILQNETQAKKLLDIEGKTESSPGKAAQPLQEKLQKEAKSVDELAAAEKAKLFEKISEQTETLPKTLREKASLGLPKDSKVKIKAQHFEDELLGYDDKGFKALIKEMQSKQGISFERLMEIRSSLNMMKNTDPSGKLYKISNALEKDIKNFISKQSKEIQENFANYNKKYSEFFASIGKNKANKNFSDEYREILKSQPHEFYDRVKGLWKEHPDIFTNMINKASSEELKPLSRELVFDLFKKGEGDPSLRKVVTNYFATHMPDFQREALNKVFEKANPELSKLGGLPKLMEVLDVITKHSPEGIKKLVQTHREKSLEGIKTTFGVWAASVTLKAVATAGGLRRGMEWVLSHPDWILKLQNLPKTDFKKFFSDSVKNGIVPSNVANQILREVASSNDKK